MATYNAFVPYPATVTTTDPVVEVQKTLSGLADYGDLARTNPPFKFVRNAPATVDSGSTILRGYIRRSKPDIADPNSQFRLNFMFNPSVIQRSYIAYLDQQALDPTNTTFGSGNLASAPGILDFSFDLLFDRQTEVSLAGAQDGVSQDLVDRGVLVDYEYFDRVVRGIDPDSPGSKKIPDNGVMMVNPNNVTAVFSPELSVTGRPYNASISFEKFSHRMVPTRMRLQISMKVLYIGPVTPSTNLADLSSEAIYEATVPYDESITVRTSSYEIAGLESISLAADLAAARQGSGSANTAVGVMGSGGSPNNGTSTASGGGPGTEVFNPPAGKSWARGVLTMAQRADLVLTVGIRDTNRAALFVAISERESGGGNSQASNQVPPDNSWGLWQINVIDGAMMPQYLAEWRARDLTDPWTNAKAMYFLSQGGSNLAPWNTNADGTAMNGNSAYDVRKYLPQALAAVRSVSGG